MPVFLYSSRPCVSAVPKGLFFLRLAVLLNVALMIGACAPPLDPRETVKGSYLGELGYGPFINPPAAFRSFTFYSVNDRLDPEELRRQVRGFHQAGLGGFYLHSREGLLTPYLEDEWWEAMEAAVSEAEACGINACFYDEDRWPSGYAGGLVPKMDETFRAQSLARIRKTTPLPPGAGILGEDDSTLFINHTAPLGNPLFNGTSYVDLLNPEMVRAFIRVAYQPYIDRFGGKGKRNKLEMFTDEPHIHARYFDRATPHLGVLTWSPSLETRYRERYGEELSQKYTLLFEEKENWREIRLRYYQCVASQFEESFTRQIGRYCEQNQMMFSGHFLGEEGLEKVRDRIGNAMLHYRNMQKPGIDNLGLTVAGRLNTARSLSSVANQYDIPERMVEIFGISGQNMNFEDRKWLAGWEAVLGVNRFVPHLTLYSLKGTRKRDYPPTFSYHQPYWDYNPIIENYCGRIALATTVGRYDPQLLVIHPLESEYIKPKGHPGYTDGLLNLMQGLQECHYDYDLGDEQILKDTAAVEKKRLVVGVMSYQAVILPDMAGIRESTWELLTRFISGGGLVFSSGRFPAFIDGVADSLRLARLEKEVIRLDPNQPGPVLELWVKPRIVITGDKASSIWSMNRVTPNGRLLFLTNSSHTETIRFTLQTGFDADHPVWWDPSLPACFRLNPNDQGLFELELPPSSAAWITTGKLSENGQAREDYMLPPQAAPVMTLAPAWSGKRLGPNFLPLDWAAATTDNRDINGDPEPVAALFNRLADQQYNGPLVLQFRCSLEEIPGNCFLVVEQPAMHRLITVNSLPVTFEEARSMIDRTFRAAAIAPLLKKGENLIRMELDFKAPLPGSARPEERYGTEIENIYLAGDFSVTALSPSVTLNSQRNQSPDMKKRIVHQARAFVITAENSRFSGNLAPEGYPFYAGAFELSQSFNWEGQREGIRYFLEFPDLESVVTVVEMNGVVADTLAWAPFRTEITHLLKPGMNELKVTLVNSLRNLLGPHHHPAGELIRVGPDSFTGAGGFPEPSGNRNWYDLRKTTPQLKLWSDTYHYIPFGFLDQPVITAAGL